MVFAIVAFDEVDCYMCECPLGRIIGLDVGFQTIP